MNVICDDKQFLAQYDLDVNLFYRFNVKPYDIYPLRSIFVVSTDKGNKVLKKISYSKEELLFIYDGIKYINNKFNRTMNFSKTFDGKIYTVLNDDIYCMIDLVEGRESDYNNPIDLGIATKGLAELHLAGEGFKGTLSSRYNSGKLINNFKRRLNEVKVFKTVASINEHKSDFDDMFLNKVDYYIEEIKKSIKLLENSSYYKLCGEENKVVFCHHDLAHHNIIIKGEEAYFIDFDYAIVDLRVHDLCNFITKAIKNYAFDIEKGKSILKEYSNINPLDKRELAVLYAMLTFPEDFYSIVKDYYTRRKDWTEETFVDKMKKKISAEEFRIDFLRGFEDVL
ncbi:CotS family spore coat protein [Clostridium lundense]|uniref:CotS family spore coat protein n=1 Tax=Clostridium lundense TaxID=319475 RepID=UPI00048937E4|nr:CotS family spore coat protein [Clostridium lundense]